MAENKTKKDAYKNTIKQLFGNDLTAELRQLIDLAVRRQFNPQDFVERLVNTDYFDMKYPGLVEKGGTLADALTGQAGVSVSVNSLASALSNYRKGLEQFQQQAQTYGYNLTKGQYALAVKHETSPQEFAARLNAVWSVDNNPALLAAFTEQAKMAGLKITKGDAYRAAVKAGDNKFRTIYEAAQFQTQLGFGAGEARGLIKDKAVNPAASFEDVNKLIAEVRGNLQGYAPELAAQGINAAKLVKVLGNPTAYMAEIDKIRQIATTRQSLYGRQVPGSYAQRGVAGGLSLYDRQGEANYG